MIFEEVLSLLLQGLLDLSAVFSLGKLVGVAGAVGESRASKNFSPVPVTSRFAAPLVELCREDILGSLAL